MTLSTITLTAAIILTSILLVSLFNNVIRRKNMVENAFACVDAMLKRRYDLIPNLVEATARYMDYERGLMERLTSLRAQASSLRLGSHGRDIAEREIGKGLQDLFATAENYPSLRASDNFLNLQGCLNETEDQIAASRRFFNAAVTDYNNALEMFPWALAARLLGYEKRDWFTVTDAREREPVSVRDHFDR
jgi:LemA protein